jgi:hypothetical protein
MGRRAGARSNNYSRCAFSLSRLGVTIPPGMVQALQSIGEYLASGAFLTFKQLLIVLGPLLLLASVLQLLSRYVRNHAATIIGGDVYTYMTAPGVMVHELGHVFFCILFGHTIIKVRLFQPDRYGTLGVVEHGYNPRNPYQLIGNFFIGTGPIWFGSAVVYLLTRFLLGSETTDPAGSAVSAAHASLTSLAGAQVVVGQVAAATWELFTCLFRPDQLSSLRFWAFLYLVFCIGSHITLSPSDIHGASRGFLSLVLVLLLVNLLTLWMGTGYSTRACDALVRWCVVLYAAILFVVSLNLALACLLFILSRVSGRRR